MKTKLFILLGVLLMHSNAFFSQTQNKFILGIYTGVHYRISSGNIVTQAKLGPYYTSNMGVVAEDGFNTILTYHPGSEFDFVQFKRYLTLIKNNNLKVIDEIPGWAKPIPNSTGVENQYVLDPSANIPYNAKYNIDMNFTNTNGGDPLAPAIYADPLFANTIIGHSLGGEMSYFHFYAYKNLAPTWVSDPQNYPALWDSIEMPPQNLSDAIGHFKGLAAPLSQLISFSSAKHASTIEGYTDNLGIYDEEDYILMSGVSNRQRPDMFSEGSYFSNEFRDWHTNYNYLGKFKSIDFVSKHMPRVITEICAQEDYAQPHFPYVYDSNPAIPNANQLWFQSYTSIIHGSTGITFYSTDAAYKANYPPDTNNINYLNGSASDRFARAYTAENYRYYISNLARELRYLIDEGFLSTDPNTVLYSKMGGTSSDPNCILPASDSYLLDPIPAKHARDYLAVNNFTPANVSSDNSRRTEQYGLRYTIRTNGTDVIMIVSNPNPYSVHNINFSFNQVTNPIIKYANGVDVLFDDGSITDVDSTSYKVESATIQKRSGAVDNNFDLLKSYHITFAPNVNGFTTDFGPFDVKVFKFTTTSSISTDWVKVWSNSSDVNKGIGGWSPISANDKFLIGDFDNNGKEDLLSITSGASNNWAVMQEYNVNTQSWDWKWANNGNNQLASDWPLSASHRYYVGNFVGDTKAEILCVSGTNGWANLYSYNGTSWVNILTNNGNSNIGGWYGFQATDNFYVADFDGNGKDNLLAMQSSSATSGKWAVMQELNTAGTSWVYQWANGGNNQLASDWPLNMAHKYYTGDFDGDGKAEIYCASGTNNYTNIYRYNNGFIWKWSNSGSPDNLNYSAGWPMPFKPNVNIVSGNIDNDSKSELLFIDEDYAASSFTAAKAQSADINSTTGKLTPNWTNSSSAFINDWSLQKGNSTYYLIKASATESNKYLLAMKDLGSISGCTTTGFSVGLYKVNNPNINFIGINLDEESISIKENEQLENLTIFPNPNNGSMTIHIASEAEKQYTLELYSMEGTRIASYPIDAGNYQFQIDQSTLMQGTYFFNLVSNNEVVSRKRLVIMK